MNRKHESVVIMQTKSRHYVAANGEQGDAGDGETENIAFDKCNHSEIKPNSFTIFCFVSRRTAGLLRLLY